MKTDYEYIIVESFNPSDTSGRHGPTHVRPIPGQGVFMPKYYVACSRNLIRDYPVGTKFKIKVKFNYPIGGTPYIYSHYSWKYDVIEKY